MLGVLNVDAMLRQACQGVGRSLGGAAAGASVGEAGTAIAKGGSAQAGDGSASVFAGGARRGWVVRVDVGISPAADGKEVSEGRSQEKSAAGGHEDGGGFAGHG